ncbi:ketoacyl-ACP synthase III family protein [Actinacidiphila acidipaludis]|uniref:Ketoacyl-ACP synthase III family protein n=1 Tax=Actinacidiphila acidipaludis TaxID=2873382 RepID=A0ABS7QC78_9ACTN|nr:ketoacyl-ACP synthase III family protein [Streptomyces acidipaludis]MBY8880279.1 ketoacyl-ACP synthase III family protein [Streptomyces acidipaludis]
MKVEGIHLAGIGTYTPSPTPVEEAVRQGLFEPGAARESGLLSVAVEPALSAPDMAVRAARQALDQAGHDPGDFAAVVHNGAYYQGPGHWSAPHYVLHRALDRPIPAFGIAHGCLAVLTSLQLAAGLLEPGSPGRQAVLITGADNFSTPMFDRWNDSELAVFADSGVALVASTRGGFAALKAVGSRSAPELEGIHRGNDSLLPPARYPDHPWRAASRRQEWAERPGAGPRDLLDSVNRFAELVAGLAERTLAEAGVAREAVTRVAPTGFSENSLHTLILDPLGLPVELSTWDHLRTLGHATVGDQVLGLAHLWRSGQVRHGDHVLLVGATEGLEAGCAVLEITRTARDTEGRTW